MATFLMEASNEQAGVIGPVDPDSFGDIATEIAVNHDVTVTVYNEDGVKLADFFADGDVHFVS